MKHYMRVCAEINLDAVAYNFRNMKENLNPETQMIAVVKTDGYGHGAVPIAQMVQEYPYVWGFATATIEEALILRKEGVKKPILILGFVFPDAYEDVVRYDIRPAVFKLSMARQLSEEAVRQQKTVHVHIKVDTGMSRIGFADTAESADIVKEISGLPNLETEGLFTHFARADERDKTAANEQLTRYQAFAKLLEDRQVQIKYHHCSNSAGIYDMKDANMDIVRAGISIYGMYPSDEVNKMAAPLAPVMSLKSHIVFIKELQPGAASSYGGTYVADSRDESGNHSGRIRRRLSEGIVGQRPGIDPRMSGTDSWTYLHGSVYGGCIRYSGCPGRRCCYPYWFRWRL